MLFSESLSDQSLRWISLVLLQGPPVGHPPESEVLMKLNAKVAFPDWSPVLAMPVAAWFTPGPSCLYIYR